MTDKTPDQAVEAAVQRLMDLAVEFRHAHEGFEFVAMGEDLETAIRVELSRATLPSPVAEVAAPVGTFDDWFMLQSKMHLADPETIAYNAWNAALKAASRAPVVVGVEPVGVLCISHHMGDPGMENIEYQPMQELPVGQHMLYVTPPMAVGAGGSVEARHDQWAKAQAERLDQSLPKWDDSLSPAPVQKVVPVAEPVAGLVEFRKLLNGQYFRFKPDGPTFERDKGGFKTHPFGDNGRWMPIDMNARVYPATPAASVPAGGEVPVVTDDEVQSIASWFDPEVNPLQLRAALQDFAEMRQLATQPILAQDAKPDSVDLAGGAGGNVHAPGPTDAERYQWLRHDLVGLNAKEEFPGLYAGCPDGLGITRENFDAAIDAAILSSEQDQAGGGGRGV